MAVLERAGCPWRTLGGRGASHGYDLDQVCGERASAPGAAAVMGLIVHDAGAHNGLDSLAQAFEASFPSNRSHLNERHAPIFPGDVARQPLRGWHYRFGEVGVEREVLPLLPLR
jgi:hypothetical protein